VALGIDTGRTELVRKKSKFLNRVASDASSRADGNFSHEDREQELARRNSQRKIG